MAKRTIKLKDYLHVVEEYLAAGTIKPGMLVELTSANKVQAHSLNNGPALVAFATEDEFQGKTIDDNYSADDKVQVWIPQRGDVAYALLAAGEETEIGDLLISDGKGALKVADASDALDGAIVGVALEAIDNDPGSGGAAVRIIVRIF